MKTNKSSVKQRMTIQRFIPVLLGLFLSNMVFSQTGEVERNITRFNITLIGGSLTTEVKLGKHTTVFAEAGVNSYARLQDEDYVFSAHPYLQIELRAYYSFKRRLRKGKNVDYNHSGFVALTAGYLFKSLNQQLFELDKRYFIGPVWGYQIFVRSRFTLETRLGIAYLGGHAPGNGWYPPDNQTILPITEIRFGVILNRKKE